jgi:hypothetical protein
VTRARPLWYDALCSIGWGFICLHWFALQEHVWTSDEPKSLLFEFFGILAAPLVVLLSAVLYSRSRVGWWWSGAAVIVAAAALAAGLWLWHWPGHIRLQNTRYYITPTAFVLSWSCVGLLVGSAVERELAPSDRVRGWVTAVFALAGGAYGLLQFLAPDMPALSDNWAAFLCPLVVLEAASFYGVIWMGARRSGQRGRRGTQSLAADEPAADEAGLTDSDCGP